MAAIGREDLANDPALAQNDGRAARSDELDLAIGKWTQDRSVDEVIGILEGAGVPVGKSFTAADIHENDHYRARGMLEEHVLPNGGPSVTIPGVVPKLSDTPGRTRWLGPAVGEHTAEVLRGLGIDDDTLARLRQQRII